MLKSARRPSLKGASNCIFRILSGSSFHSFILLGKKQVLYISPRPVVNIWNSFQSVDLNWQEIYNLPFKVLIDSNSREFQYKILNRFLTTNSFLYKIGLIASPLCTFCGLESESLEHLLISCPFTNMFWLDFIS